MTQFHESDDELRELLAATIQRRDTAAAEGLQVEAESLNNLAIAIDDELRQRADARREQKSAECDELHRIYFGQSRPPRATAGWTGRNGLE